MHSLARVAKLVDAPGLGPDASNGVGVRVPSLAPEFCWIMAFIVNEVRRIIDSTPTIFAAKDSIHAKNMAQGVCYGNIFHAPGCLRG